MDVFKEADVNADELDRTLYFDMYQFALSGRHRSCAGRSTCTAHQARPCRKEKEQAARAINVTGQITDADFLKMNRQCDEEIERVRAAVLLSLRSSSNSQRRPQRAHRGASAACCRPPRDDAVQRTSSTRDFVHKYIDQHLCNGRIMIKLYSCKSNFLPVKARCGICKISERRSGHTFKKMIESYEQNMANQG